MSTLINREPSLCAPLLPEILLTVSRVIRDTQYSWELDSNVYVPQNSRSIAKQFIRCALHQLSGNHCNMTIWISTIIIFIKYLKYVRKSGNIVFLNRQWDLFYAIFDGAFRRTKNQILWNTSELSYWFYGVKPGFSGCIISTGIQIRDFCSLLGIISYMFLLLYFVIKSCIVIGNEWSQNIVNHTTGRLFTKSCMLPFLLVVRTSEVCIRIMI